MTAAVKINYMAAKRPNKQIIWRPPDKLTELCGSRHIIQFCGGRQIIKLYVATATYFNYMRRPYYYIMWRPPLILLYGAHHITTMS